jgi:hypothetical protein
MPVSRPVGTSRKEPNMTNDIKKLLCTLALCVGANCFASTASNLSASAEPCSGPGCFAPTDSCAPPDPSYPPIEHVRIAEVRCR